MIIYNPHDEYFIDERLKEAESILAEISVKHCFITGSFLYKEKFEDIDVFVVTRSQKKFTFKNKKIKVSYIDFNDISSLFYHSVSKSCAAKSILPHRPLKVTLSDYWSVVNEAIPTLLNQKDKFHKSIRFLVLYTEYFKTGEILDTFQLNEKINSFQTPQEIFEYVKIQLPALINKLAKLSYIKRFFYTQAGYYKELREYKAQNFLYSLTHEIARNRAYG